MTAADLLDKATELGVRVVQICDNLPLDALPEPQLEQFRATARQRGITIEVGTRGVMPQHLERQLALAGYLASPILRVVIDTANHRPSLDEAVELLALWRSKLEHAGVCLAVENHDRFSAAQFRDMMTRLNSRHIGICLDTVNSFGALEGPGVVVAALAPWVVNLHIKDFTIRRVDHQLGFVIEGCPAGQGRLDIPWLLRELRAAGRTHHAILEQWPARESSLETTLENEKAWAATSVAYLRTLIRD
jgi:sugar phosphate isomerase/epimerase